MASYDSNNIIGSFLPRVNFKRIILEPAKDSLIVTVDLVIKEILNPENPVSSWYGNQDFSQFLKIGIIHTVDPNLTQALSKSRFAFYEEYDKIGALNYWNNSTGATQFREIELVDQNQVPLEDMSYVTDSDGNRVYTINYQTQFTVEAKNPNHLAYFADVMLNVDAIRDKFDLNEELNFEGNNNPTSEIVIENAKIKSTTHVFVTQDGDLWKGQVHYHGEQNPDPTGYIGWMGGLEHSPDQAQPRLIMKSVPNYVVQDLRSVERLDRRPLDLNKLSKIGHNLMGSIKTFISGEEYKHAAKNSYFTKLYHSKDLSGRARLMFGLDEKNLFIDKSKYGKFYDGESYGNIKDEAIVLKSMKIIRNRIENYQPGNSQASLMDHAESDDPHVEDKKRVNFQVASLNSPEVLNTITELPQALANSTGVRYFTATDNDVATEERGYYQYGIELEYEDNTIDYFKEKLNNLDVLMKNFKLYHEEAKFIGIQQFYQEISDPHIDTPLETGQLPTGDPKSAFNVSSNRFNKWFVDEMQNKYPTWQAKPYWAAIVSFRNLLYDLAVPQQIANEATSPMFPMSNPETGSPGGISKVIATIETMIQKIRTLLGLSHATLPAGDTTSLGVSKSVAISKASNKKRTIKIVKWFKLADEVLDATDDAGVGYDFLSMTKNFNEGNLNGLMTIGSDVYKNRVNLETAKYFKDIDDTISHPNNPEISDSLSSSKYSYLSPSWIRLGGKNRYYSYTNLNFIDSKSSKSTTQSYNNIGSMILMKNATEKNIGEILNLVQDSSNADVTPAAAALAHIFADRGCTAFVTETSTTFTAVDITDNNFNLDVAAADQLMEKPQNFEIQKGNEGMGPEQEKAMNQMSAGAFAGFTPTLSPFAIGEMKDIWDPALAAQLIDAAVAEGMMAQAFRDLPNHLKSIIGFVSSTRDYPTNKYNSPQTIPKFYMNYENLMRVEYLSTFENNQVLNPVWLPLNGNLFADTAPGRQFLCRLKRYENKQYNINENTAMKLPVYNQYFIIQHKEVSLQEHSQSGPELAEELNVIYSENAEHTHGNIMIDKALTIAKTQPAEEMFTQPSTPPANTPSGPAGAPGGY